MSAHARIARTSRMKFSDVVSPGFSTLQAARLTGLSPRQLDHWDRKGFVKPSIGAARGYGSKRRYSFADVVRLRVAARLRAAGVGLARIQRCAEALERLGGDAADLVLVFSVGDAVEETAGAVARLTREGSPEGSSHSQSRGKQLF